MTRIRGDNGKFIQKSNELRPVRSIRATDSTWEMLGNIADKQRITRADLIEHFALNHVLHESLEKENEKLKDEMAVLRLQLSDMEGKTSFSNHGNPQQLDMFSGIKQLDRDLLHQLRDRVLGMKILSVGEQSKYYKETVKVLNKFISLLLKEL
ncbi:MAG: hypothetical protein KA717_19455 [Woronichinia naegeliana WA131]|jgi:hypothetical protein|uniref:Uncharacterized protein n=3 Tax=Cyanophyceae TaxID=3028117 RepID=A0A977PUL2_9CYAN|nr:MAG: hypothetical protein AN484_24745 [Aphanizomenon flos-aquae WA102]UXE58866.1 MAG: hypothetical protein KA717_23040 [Woronichinia naegeliana WA131]UXE59203.1 MAG: hypothetical protein KA717_25250 [Woronichinia naegeliana WA131]UXE59262.1 MAG: hypothetical protein KA717_25745 [Woronichinia naegeliana WA131]UXE59722.1 MAG: hypothetical protein KA717_28870 [Woronichinia naegeliana WA131]